MSASPPISFFADLPAERGFHALVAGISVPARQHPVRGLARPVPADHQQAATGSDQHGTDALDHPFSQVIATGSR